MKLFNAAMASFATLIAGAFVAAPVAAAQGTSVVVIDQERIMTQSQGGQDIAAQVEQIGTTIQSELTPEATAIQEQGQSLETRTANMSMEAIAADEALRTEVEAYAQRAQQFNRKRQIAAAELQATERAAWMKFFQALQPVLEEVVTETGADVMLDSSQVVWSAEAIDVTQSVITKMNAAMPTVEVTRQTLPAQARQQIQQQQQ